MPLSATKVKNAKPKNKVYRLPDQGGLCLEVKPSGKKYWRYRYRFNKKANMISLGQYPATSLSEARERHAQARNQLDAGINPAEAKKMREEEAQAEKDTFELVAREYLGKEESRMSPKYATQTLRRLEKDIFPFLGKRPIAELKAPEILKVMQKIEDRGAPETARRLLQKCGQIFRYAVARGKAPFNPTIDLRGAIPPPAKRHHPTIIDPKAVGELLRAIEDYHGQPETRCALKLAYLTFVRPGELRKAEWSEINLEEEQWRIPAARMKMRVDHIVPLSKQAIEVLNELLPFTGTRKFLFPGIRSKARPMSNNTINAALRRMGYSKEEITGHGFRSMASTLLNEMGWNRDAIERQLAHAERDEVRAAYNYAQYLPERREMMQAWADYLGELKATGKVLPFKAEGE